MDFSFESGGLDLADVKAGEFAPWYESWRAGVRAALRHGDRDMATAEMEANG